MMKLEAFYTWEPYLDPQKMRPNRTTQTLVDGEVR
jgi:hypothetical protein